MSEPTPSLPDRTRFLRGGFFACAVLTAFTPALGNAGLFSSAWTWPKVQALVRDRFPSVSPISTGELERRLTLSPSERPILLDVRSAPEFAVSQIKDAQPAFTEAMALAALAGRDKSRPVVVYCSVGYRSAALAHKLAARGYTNVSNLDGSLFMWANEGRPVYAGTQRATRVHPYNAAWGVLLNEDLRYVPDAPRPRAGKTTQ